MANIDIEIAQKAVMTPISEVAATVGLSDNEVGALRPL